MADIVGSITVGQSSCAHDARSRKKRERSQMSCWPLLQLWGNTLRPGGHVAVEFMVRFWLYVSHLRAVPLRISQPRAAAEGRHNPLIFSLMSGW